MKLAILSIIAAATLASNALADSFDFLAVSGVDTYTFTLDTAAVHQNIYGFSYLGVAVSDNGVVSDLDAYTTAGFLDFRIGRLGQTDPSFISDGASTETFVTGIYTSYDSYDGRNYIFSITPSVSAAPEPGAWALMMLGIGAIGAMLGYRKRVVVDETDKLAAIT